LTSSYSNSIRLYVAVTRVLGINARSFDIENGRGAWSKSEFAPGRLACTLRIKNKYKLQAILRPRLNGGGSLTIPTPTIGLPDGDSIARIMSHANARELNLGNSLYERNAGRVSGLLGIELDKIYEGQWAKIITYPYGEDEDGAQHRTETWGVTLVFAPNEGRKGEYMEIHKIATGLAEDLKDILPGWKLQPANHIKIWSQLAPPTFSFLHIRSNHHNSHIHRLHLCRIYTFSSFLLPSSLTPLIIGLFGYLLIVSLIQCVQFAPSPLLPA
jgi:hypothetical protein